MQNIEYSEQQKQNDKLAMKFNTNLDMTDKYAKILTGEGFVCFKPGLTEKDEKGNYKLPVAFPEGSEIYKQIKKLVDEYRQHVYGDARKLKMPLKSGKKYLENKIEVLEEDGADDEEIQKFKDNYGHLAGCWYINMSTKFELNDPTGKRSPNLLGPNLAPIDADEIEGTDIVRVKFSLFTFDKGKNKGVALGLRACQLIKKGSWEGGSDSDNTEGFEAAPIKDGEDESNAGLSSVDKETAEPDEQEEKPAKKKTVKKTVKKKAEPVEEPEEDDDDDEEYEDEDDSLSDDEVFDEE